MRSGNEARSGGAGRSAGEAGTAPTGASAARVRGEAGSDREAGRGREAGTAPTGAARTAPDSVRGSVPDSEAGTAPTGGRPTPPTGDARTAPVGGVGTGGSARRSQVRSLLGRTSGQRPSVNPARAAQRIARRAVTKIVDDSQPSTNPIPIVAVLRGTPYSAPVEAAAKNEDEARRILDLAVDMGAIMMRAGSSTQDVQVSVIAVCTSLGLSTAEVDLTSNSLTVHYMDPEGRMLTVMRVNREESLHFAKLSAVHALVTELVDGKLDYQEARDRLDAIRRQKRPYPEWLVSVAWGALVAGFVNLVGGSWVSSLLGFVITLANMRFGTLLGRTRMPYFFIVVFQAMAITVIAMLANTLHLISTPQFLVASGIVLLLPTMGLVSAVQDALTDFPLTASGRVIQVGLSFTAIVTGIAAGITVGDAVGLRTIEVTLPSTGTQFLTTLVSLFAALLVAAGGAIGMQASKRLLLPTSLIGLAGFVVMVLCLVAGLHGMLTSFLASTVVGLLARPTALRLGAPPSVILIPGIYPILSGLSIFTAAYTIVQPAEGVNLSDGLSALFTAVATNAALAVGGVFGGFLATALPYGKAGRRFMRRRGKSAAEADS
ncbi:threonine/serine ThrE exporter family protein [Brevibacterium album]|uniref:threonine/serine ThrE exporter family protein n=1 Tax=Brevibacterium album TaxID=417948 RepID=UPI0003FE2E04|nr:threonine/serine exporter family protein [Brevibacterium album]